MYDYNLFKNSMSEYIKKSENLSNESHKKVLDAVKDFLEAIDSLGKLNPIEANEFLTIISKALASSLIVDASINK